MEDVQQNSGPGMRAPRPLLHEFLVANREVILERSRDQIATRHAPVPTSAELVHGLPLFLDQLIAVLRASKGERVVGRHDLGESAARHGADLLRHGLTVGQVVQDYGSICQSVTELADERHTEITADDFQVFNRCLDDAIAQAVTSYESQRDGAVDRSGAEHLGVLGHEMRNLLNTAMLTFDALVRGRVGIQGSTGALLGRSLRGLRVVIDRTLAEVRLGVGKTQPERVMVAALMEEIEIVATLEARERDLTLSIDHGPQDVAVNGDQQILASAVANLVQNAFKFTRPNGHIWISARTRADRVLIEVQDECGGLRPGKVDELFLPFEQRNTDQSGIGLGLSISLKGVRANGGEIHALDHPGKGCTFTIDLPRAA